MSTTAEARPYRPARRPGALELVVDGFREISSHRRLTRYLVRADLKKHGSDTVLGNVWWVLDPLLQMAVYVVLLQVIFNVQIPDYPLFVFCAILPWKWFSTAVNDGISSVTSRERIIKQVKFPKIVLPVAATTSGVVNFAFGLIPLVALMLLFYSHRISPYLFLIPAIAAVQFVFSLACAVLVAGINVFFRDIANVARHALRLWFYLSPALYSYDAVAGRLDGLAGRVLSLNPWTPLFESYRDVIYNSTMPDWGGLLVLLGFSAVFLVLAMLFFKRVEPSFAKVL
ncbi:MAG TPA: ABC transporter permease [Candidatus Limnocylindrales bacterium]|nr:ABC transporter permease [Candidatus Limnocylindrales bacterium]